MKKTYIQPELTVHGDVEALTEASTSGSKLDKTIVAGTPLTEIVITVS